MEGLYRAETTRPIPLCPRIQQSYQPVSQSSALWLTNGSDDFSRGSSTIVVEESTTVPLWSVVDGEEQSQGTAQPLAIPCVTLEILDMLEDKIKPSGWVVFLMVVFALIFVVGVIGNILVCVAIARYKFVRSVTAVFIASLAISDINVLLICLPVTVIDDVYHTWYWGTATCKTIKFFQQLFVFVTILTLAMLAAERYATICYYSYGRGCRNYRKRRKFRDAVAIVVAVWVISVLLALPEVFRVTAVPVFADSPLLTSCQSEWPIWSDLFLQIFYFLFLFVLPLGVIGFCYYKIVRALSGGRRSDESAAGMQLPADPSCPSLMVPSTMFPTRSRSSSATKKETKISQLGSDYSEPPQHQHNLLLQNSGNNSRNTSFSLSANNNNNNINLNHHHHHHGSDGSREDSKTADIPATQLRQRWRLTKMLITIVILFLVSYLPVYIYLLLRPFDLVTTWISSMGNGDSTNWRLHWDVKTGVALAVHCLVYINSTLNPVIYYFMSDKFRQAFRKLLFCGVLKRWCDWRRKLSAKRKNQQTTTNGCYSIKEIEQQEATIRIATPVIPVIVVGSNSSGTPSMPVGEQPPQFPGPLPLHISNGNGYHYNQQQQLLSPSDD